mmetsp:Transcript_37744/g.112099  ORF Transcript_37744/g.112099 Transcript_37744/m.112099 type:complete len:327 (+) Transcript_37744:656-1636(+)
MKAPVGSRASMTLSAYDCWEAVKTTSSKAFEATLRKKWTKGRKCTLPKEDSSNWTMRSAGLEARAAELEAERAPRLSGRWQCTSVSSRSSTNVGLGGRPSNSGLCDGRKGLLLPSEVQGSAGSALMKFSAPRSDGGSSSIGRRAAAMPSRGVVTEKSWSGVSGCGAGAGASASLAAGAACPLERKPAAVGVGGVDMCASLAAGAAACPWPAACGVGRVGSSLTAGAACLAACSSSRRSARRRSRRARSGERTGYSAGAAPAFGSGGAAADLGVGCRCDSRSPLTLPDNGGGAPGSFFCGGGTFTGPAPEVQLPGTIGAGMRPCGVG